MKKFEKSLRKKVSSCNMETYEPSEELFNKIADKLGVISKKRNLTCFAYLTPTFVCSILLLLMVFTIGMINPVYTDNLNTPYTTIVQLDVNPSIQMVVDETSTVVSISGLNDDGKLVIINEELVGKKVDEVVSKVIEVENKLGYLKEENDKPITLKVTTDDKKNLSIVKDTFTLALNDALDDNKLDINVEYIKGYTIDELRGFVLKYDPILTKKVVEDFTFEQLVEVIKTYHLEIINFATVELEELYLDFKGMQVKLLTQALHYEEVMALDDTFVELKNNFEKEYFNLMETYELFQVEYYNQYLDSTSEYRTAMENFADAKEKYLAQKEVYNSLSPQATEYQKYVEKTKLDNLEYDYVIAQRALKEIKKAKEKTYNSIIKNFDLYIANLQLIFEEVPQETNISALAQLINTEEKKSELNKAISLKFGEKYKVTISLTYEKVNDIKNETIDSNK